MATITGANIYIDGIKHNTDPVPLDGQSYDISDVKSVGDVVQVNASYVYDDGTESTLSESKNFVLDFTIALSPSQVTEDTIFWPQIMKSSENPRVTTTKEYFVIYSSDHAPVGGIYWGEFDSLEGNNLVGFVERGAIVTGDQAETPWPVSKDDEFMIFYHTDQESGNVINQETRLITTTGGELHNAEYTDHGRPFGVNADDDHTGYGKVREREDGIHIANHLTKGGADPEFWISQSTDGGYTFSRLQQIDPSYNMPEGTHFVHHSICDFEYLGKRFGFIIYRTSEDSYIGLVALNDLFLPSYFIRQVDRGQGLKTLNMHKEGNTVYLLHKKGGVFTGDYGQPYQMSKYDLNDFNLEQYIVNNTGLVSSFSFENPTGDAIDSHGGHNGTLTGEIERDITAKVGKGVNFIGSNASLTGGELIIPHHSDFVLNDGTNNKQFAFSFWVNFDKIQDCWIFNKRNDGPLSEYQLRYYQGEIIFSVHNTDDSDMRYTKAFALNPSVDYHIAGYLANDTIEIFINNEEAGGVVTGEVKTLRAGTSDVVLGKATFSNGFNLSAVVDEFRLWCGAEVPTDFSNEYNNGSGITL